MKEICYFVADFNLSTITEFCQSTTDAKLSSSMLTNVLSIFMPNHVCCNGFMSFKYIYCRKRQFVVLVNSGAHGNLSILGSNIKSVFLFQ